MRQAPGPLQSPALAHTWLADAQRILSWLEHSGLVNMRTGNVRDHYNGRCQAAGGAVTYTEGEMAEALTQMGGAVTYDSFLLAQGRAVIANAASDARRPTHCQTVHARQIDFYWSRRVSAARLPVQLTPGSQQSGLAALSSALVAAGTGS